MTIPKPTFNGFLKTTMYIFILALVLKLGSNLAPGVTEKVRTQLLI